MFPKGFFSPSYFPDKYWDRQAPGVVKKIGSRGAAPALRQLISLALAEQEHRSLLAERTGIFRISVEVLQVRVAANKAAFERELKRKRFHSIYSLLVAEL